MLRIGIPRGFYYYRFFNIWPKFFFHAGAEAVISPPTNKTTVSNGVKLAVDETCLPFKVYMGHVESLQKACDYIFVPRIVSVEKKAYSCPKIIGLPDVCRLIFPDANLFSPAINQYGGGEPRELIEQTAQLLRQSTRRTGKAWEKAVKESHKYKFSVARLPADFLGHTKVSPNGYSKGRLALLGHCYNIYDNYITMDLIDKLRNLGYDVLTLDVIPKEELDKESQSLPKKMFWTIGSEILSAGRYFLKRKDIDGVIYLACFGCGADALIGELVMRFKAKEGDKPLLMLNIDEHTGEAGFITRIEAFTDMLARRKKQSENYISSHGESEYHSQSII